MMAHKTPYSHGWSDAETWMDENPREIWAKSVAKGQLDADEALINALGLESALRAIGYAGPLERTDDGGGREVHPNVSAALAAYCHGWRECVLSACADGAEDSIT